MTPLLEHLAVLVACDTRNPPRRLTPGDRIFAYLRAQLGGFAVELVDEGEGCISLLAVRGRPKTLINVHLDTVPDNEQWTRDPLELLVENGRAVGLGACDIKGAAAALLAAAAETQGDIALLFSTDEEHGQSLCVHRFLSSGRALLEGIELVVVCEPTRGEAVLAHRGFARGEVRCVGVPGHSSEPRAFEDSAVHKLGRWLCGALDYTRAREHEGALGLHGLRFNCGVVEGGRADNVIAGNARALFSLRPPPGLDPAEAVHLVGAAGGARADALFVGPALPSGDVEERAARARAFAARYGVSSAAPVSFWTEAALFSAAGFVTFVCGPGDIAQAHTADEFVDVAELVHAQACYARLMTEAG